MKEALPHQQSLHLIVEGQVQGVYYRQYCREKATALGITGTVSNCADGTVEIYATGIPEALKTFQEWCRSGSPRSQVVSVHARQIPLQIFEAFGILR